jgi:putative oxidoreductase
MSDNQRAYGLTVQRLTLGVIFGAHGLANTFGMFGGRGIRAFTANVAEYATTMPTALAWLIAIAQLAIGAMLLVGSFARMAAWLALLVVAGSMWFLGRYQSLLLPGGCEYHLALAAMSLCTALAGPGMLAWNVQIKKSQ